MSNLFYQISLRADGGMKLSDDLDSSGNRRKFLHKIGLDSSKVISAQLTHGEQVAIVGKNNSGKAIPQTDGLITNEKGVFLSITVADCLPIILYHPQKQIIALLHAGWQGLDKEIIKKAIFKIQNEFLINSEDMVASIGPGIEACHYEVQKDLVDKFAKYNASENRDGKSFLDLKKIAKIQLLDLGIKSENIEVSDVCTYCQSDKYFSFRKDKIKPVQAMMVVVGMKNS